MDDADSLNVDVSSVLSISFDFLVSFDAGLGGLGGTCNFGGGDGREGAAESFRASFVPSCACA